jgi:hypothetical protein
MPTRSTRQTTPARASKGNEGYVYDFLLRELPSPNKGEARRFEKALERAGQRYDRYSAAENRKQWFSYIERSRCLQRIASRAEELAGGLGDLDVLSRDDLSNRIEWTKIEALIGSLLLLYNAVEDVRRQMQTGGRPRNLAEERWILELADIYENAFAERARAWKSESGSTSKFYRFLQASLPDTFPRYGKLSRQQINRVLRRRVNDRKRTLSL